MKKNDAFIILLELISMAVIWYILYRILSLIF